MTINPSETLDDALEALFDNDDRDLAREKLAQLQTWLQTGGVNPDFSGRSGQWRCEKMMDCLFLLMLEDD